MNYQLIILGFLITILYGCEEQNSNSEDGTVYINSVDGTKIAYQVHGEGSLPLVFVHGWCCDKSYWNKQIEYFKMDYMIVTIDLAGHGESDSGRYNNNNFKEVSYNLIKNWYFPEADSTLHEWIANDMSSAVPEVGISALKNLIRYNYSDLQSSLAKLGDTPMYSINAGNDNDVIKFRENGVNFVESIKVNSVSHFLMMSPAEHFNVILKEKLEDIY